MMLEMDMEKWNIKNKICFYQLIKKKYIEDNGKKTKETSKENCIMLMVENTLDNGRMVWWMEKENSNMLMVVNTLDSLRKIRGMVKENCIILMVIYSLDSGKII